MGGSMGKRGRKKRVGGSRSEDQAREEGRQRIVYRQGNSWVVAVPVWVRQVLACVEGGAVYWHDAGRGAVVLSDSPTRSRGAAVVTSMERELGRLRRVNARLQRRVLARPLKALHEGKSVGWAEAQRYYQKLAVDIERVLGRLDEWERRYSFRPRVGRRRVERVVAPVLDEEPRPDPSPPAAPASGGDAAVGGEAPRAAHAELSPQPA